MMKKTVGILGAGQLGRMLAEAGQKLDLNFRFLDPATEISAKGLGEHHCAAYEDVDALEEFSNGLDHLTYEFENVSLESVNWLAKRVDTAPNSEALRVARDRSFEKNAFQDVGIPTPPFASVYFRDEFDEAIGRIGYPCVMKTRRFGYDGKGQRVIKNEEDAEKAWEELNGIPLFLEGFVPFDRELSLLAVRNRAGECKFWPLVENHHREGILRVSIAPAPELDKELQALAEDYARRLLNKLNYVGVLAVEFFQTGKQLFANEMAPRVHNSGHWSIEGSQTSQFENHLRAVCDLDLGETECPPVYSVMLNLIGEMPASIGKLVEKGYHLHDYDKAPRPGRKLAHITACSESKQGIADLLKENAVGDVLTDELRQLLEKRLEIL